MKTRLIIAIDGLNARSLGPYGNNWIPTPFFDRLAATGTVYDQFWGETTSGNHNLLAMLTARHALLPQPTPPSSLVPRVLLTDDEQLGEPVESLFDSVDLITSDRSPEAPWESLFSAAIERLLATGPSVDKQTVPEIWLHTRGLWNPWDAPLEIQEHFKDETDPPPLSLDGVPSLTLQPDHDPDERLVYLHAHAAEVFRLDRGLNELWRVIHDAKLDCDLVVTGLSGFALGEHLEIGEAATGLHAERLQLPLIVSTADGLPRRNAWLSSSHHFQELLALPPQAEIQGPAEDRVIVAANADWSRIQTRAWAYLHPVGDHSFDDPVAGQLFVKPDDWLEMNEVAGVCPEIADDLRQELQRQLAAFHRGTSAPEPQLPPAAYQPVD